MDKLELTSEQKDKAIAFWNANASSPPSVKDLVVHVFEKECDTVSPESKAIVALLASRRLKAKKKVDMIELSEAHKEFIKNNGISMTALDMAKTIFSNPSLTNLNAETRVVNEYVKELKKQDILPANADNKTNDDIPDGEYIPPDSIFKALKKVNTCTNNSFKIEDLPAQLKKGLESIVKYLSAYRFIRQINSFDNVRDRKSFEDAFIRYTYDKPYLTQEEIDQYITLANEVVLSFKAQRRGERLQQMLEEITNNDDESVRLSMSLVEMIGKSQTEYNLCIKRQQDLFEDLTEKRSEKLSKQIKDNASVLNLIQAWKQEEHRKKWLKYVEIEDKAIETEIEKLTSMEEIKGKILGLTKEEAKYG